MLTRKRNKLFATLTCGAWLLAAAGAAQASTINISLTSPIIGAAGSVLTLNGALANTTTSPVFLNSLSINLAGFPPTNLDPTPFYTNAPVSLNGSASTANIGLLNVTVPNPFASGPYMGTFTLLGGASAASQTNLGSASFTVQVGTPTGVPEPASAALIAIGAAFLIAGAHAHRGRKGWIL